jgi:hypothetical protein
METRRVRLLVRSGPGIDQRPLPVALADSKHPLGRTAFGTPRTGELGDPGSVVVDEHTGAPVFIEAGQLQAHYRSPSAAQEYILPLTIQIY